MNQPKFGNLGWIIAGSLALSIGLCFGLFLIILGFDLFYFFLNHLKVALFGIITGQFLLFYRKKQFKKINFSKDFYLLLYLKFYQE